MVFDNLHDPLPWPPGPAAFGVIGRDGNHGTVVARRHGLADAVRQSFSPFRIRWSLTLAGRTRQGIVRRSVRT